LTAQRRPTHQTFQHPADVDWFVTNKNFRRFELLSFWSGSVERLAQWVLLWLHVT